MQIDLRRLTKFSVVFGIVALVFIASGTAATPQVRPAAPPKLDFTAPGFSSLPAMSTARTSRSAAALGAEMSASRLAPSRTTLKALGDAPSTASSSSPNGAVGTNAFLGYVYYANYFAAVYDGAFNSDGVTWYYQIYYFYAYSGTYLGYGVHYWYYYFGWNYYGWVCCGY